MFSKIADPRIADNDEALAKLGQDLLDQYLGWCRRYGEPENLSGWASFAQSHIQGCLVEERLVCSFCHHVIENEDELQDGQCPGCLPIEEDKEDDER